MVENDMLETFREVNEVAPQGGIVFLGADFFASLPINELATVFNVKEAIYNRSLCGATVKSISSNLNECVFSLAPCKIFINLGEVEEKNNADIADFIASYEWLLYALHNQTSAEIYVISIMSETANEMNKAMSDLCTEVGCHFIDITSALKSARPKLIVFSMLKYYLHTSPLDFADIMCIK